MGEQKANRAVPLGGCRTTTYFPVWTGFAKLPVTNVAGNLPVI